MTAPGQASEGTRDQCASKELDTVLTALYVEIDDYAVLALDRTP